MPRMIYFIGYWLNFDDANYSKLRFFTKAYHYGAIFDAIKSPEYDPWKIKIPENQVRRDQFHPQSMLGVR